MTEEEKRRYRMLRGIYAYMGSSPSGNKIGRGSGEVITFDTNLAAPLISLTLDIEPHQAGSGDPSPTNVRPITGYTGINVYVSPTGNISDAVVYPIAFPAGAGTVYGGTLDVTNGVLTVYKVMTTVGDLPWSYDSSNTRFAAVVTPSIIHPGSARKTPFVTSQYISVDDGRSLSAVPNYSIYGAATTDTIYIKDLRYTSGSTFRSAQSDVQIVYPLLNTQTYHLTPTEVRTLIGTNNIFMDADGTVTAEYQYRS